jgi:predicted enzyme related to lactoylglutathione lyase
MAATQTVTIRGIDISTYLVKDAERAKKFYSETLGLKMTNDFGPSGGEFTFPDGTTFGIWKMDDGSWNPGLGIMFNVDDTRAAVDYYKSRGVKFVDHIEDTPVCVMAFGEDSEGNHFILHQRKNGRD